MKIDRMIGILSVLLQYEKVTAPELAKMFEVSRLAEILRLFVKPEYQFLLHRVLAVVLELWMVIVWIVHFLRQKICR